MKEIFIDKKDKDILSLLELNARMPHSQIAKKVRLSKQVVKYRIEKLEKNKIIKGYRCLQNQKSLGYDVHVILLKFNNLTYSELENWLKKIKKHENVLSGGFNLGNYDISIILKSKNDLEFLQTINQIFENVAKNIKKRIVLKFFNSQRIDSGIFNKKKFSFFIDSNVEDKKIDSLDNDIIILLQKNAKMSLVDISLKLKKPINTIKTRIRNLENNCILKSFITDIDFELLGYIQFRVYIHLKKSSDKIIKEIRDYLIQKKGVFVVSQYIGYSEIDFGFYSKDLDSLVALTWEIRDRFKETIRDIRSFLTYGWR